MRIPALFVTLLLLTSCSNGQPAAPQQPAKQPGTALEAFMGKHGRMIIKDSYDLGSVSSMGTVKMDALVIYEPNSTQKNKGLRIEVEEAGRLQRTNLSFVDLDELDSLSQALSYIVDLAGKWGQTHDPYTEVIYTSKGEFQVGFYQRGTQKSAFCRSGTIGSVDAFLKIDDMATLKGYVDKAIILLKGK